MGLKNVSDFRELYFIKVMRKIFFSITNDLENDLDKFVS